MTRQEVSPCAGLSNSNVSWRIAVLLTRQINRTSLCAKSSRRAVSDPTSVMKGLGEPKRGEVQRLYHSPDLTILNVVWAPKVTIMPHDHRMWAVIGVYTGREDNIFWRRVPGKSGGKL